jgi:3-hydroxyanthranilate 3,4-dioxygenase
MNAMPIANLPETMQALTESGAHVRVLWQEPGGLAFVARGRPYRSEFHIDPSDELMYVIKGELRLHTRTPDGKEEVAVLPEGSAIFTPSGVPHSPHFAPDAFLLVVERPRTEGEIDRFQWFCPRCDSLVHEEQFIVRDYRDDPVTAAYRRFSDKEDFRTCTKCGEVIPPIFPAR